MKRTIIEMMIAQGSTLLQVDARACAGLPDSHATDRQLCLRLGHGMEPKMHLDFDEVGVHGWFSFNRLAHYVTLPWAAIYAAKPEGSSNEDGITFPAAVFRAGSELPPQRPEAKGPPQSASDDTPGTTRPRPKLKLVD